MLALPARREWIRRAVICLAWIAVASVASGQSESVPTALSGSRVTEGFEQPQPSWSVQFDRTRVRLVQHGRTDVEPFSGSRCELLQFESQHTGQRVQLEHRLPSARVFDDLQLSLRVRSNRPGASVWLQLVFPRQVDPRTGDPLTTWIRGGSAAGTGEWEELRVQTTDRLVTQQLQLLRKQTGQSLLDDSGLYVQSVMLSLELVPGPTALALDQMSFGPVIPPEDIVPIAATDSETDSSPVAFNLGRLTVNNQPMFLRMTPHHAEDVGSLAEAGFNLLWVPRLQDVELLQSIRQHGMWAVAMPPRSRDTGGEELDAAEASLVPFTSETLPILGWYLGTRIPADMQAEVISRTRQIRSADRKYRRPLIADVTGAERVYSRHVSMLGISRHNLNSSFSFLQLRDWLSQRRQTALPGTFTWTWIQTEPMSSNADWRRRAGVRPIVVEPEQIRLQVYAALSAGVRGIGFWKTTSLDDDSPGSLERRLAIQQLNLEMSLIEDWLATGRLQGQVRFEVDQQRSRPVGPRSFDYARSTREQVALGRLRDQQAAREDEQREIFEAAMIRGQRGVLLLPMYYDLESQFVPGRMTARNATFIVPGVEETASAYEISTTGVRSLRAERGTGGMRVVLEEFDQTAIILLTTDRSVRLEMEDKVRQLASTSARVAMELASAKQSRVRDVIGELNDLTVSPGDARRMLQQADSLLTQAQASFDRQDYDGARKRSRTAMQLLRILQRAYWDEAIWNLESPVSSPYTTAFQTLPDHWRMMSLIGASPMDPDGNVLRSGDFEDIETMVVEGWRHSQSEQQGVIGAVDLHPDSREGQYCLRLRARRTAVDQPYRLLQESPVTVVTPPLTVHAGQILHISGWIRIPVPPRDSLDGVMIFDSLTGASGAIRMSSSTNWKRFELIREIHESGPFELTFALTGTGEVQLDDVRIVPHEPRAGNAAANVPPTSADRNEPAGIPLIRRIPGLGQALRSDGPNPPSSGPRPD